MEELDKELEKRVNILYPMLKEFISFTREYNNKCDYGSTLFSEYDQQCLERSLGSIEDVKNNL